jgi:Leucine-rich repeat (LRR) protein
MPAGNSSSTSPPVFLGTGRFLDLSSNAISGTIPKELSTLTLLRELRLSHNKLTGNIPTQFTKLAALQTLNLNKNALSKAIPTTLGNWGANVG